ncbi:MAG: LysM peptidoglycan-binding domain-containing protein [Tannerellaceae bacterium]
MNKIRVYVLVFSLCLAGSALYAQGVHRQTNATTNEQRDDIFYHTIERGQTVYAIATMYGVSVEDIYRLNPESREGIKIGFTLKIPQREAATSSSPATAYAYHTIQPKETLYSLTVRYNVLASDLIQVNPGLSASTFQIGRTIRIPATRIEALPTTAVHEVRRDVSYTIGKRETMYSICRKFNVSSAELLKRNPELKGGIKSGMVIQVPVQTEETVIQTVLAPQEHEVNALLSAPRESKQVSMVKVALLLPFMTEEAVPSATTSRFIEYYEGLLLAIDSLRQSGCSVDLSVYDTGNGTKRVKEILKEESLLQANLIIGAVQNDQITPVAAFAEKHNIKYVIPFTSKNDDVLSNPAVFQVNTPHSYLYSKAAEAGCDLFSDFNIILLNTHDKEEKTDFIKAFKAEMKQRHIAYKELSYVGETFQTDIEALMNPSKRNVVLPLSSSLDALNKIKSPLRMLAEAKPEYALSLFGYPEWQTYTRECLEDFYALNAYIYSNFYADNLSPNVRSFYRNYKTWYSKNLINTFPKYGMLGFDTGMFFFRAIQQYGENFENQMARMNYNSVQTGFDFQRVNAWGGFVNTSLFIIHYKSDFTVTRSEQK